MEENVKENKTLKTVVIIIVGTLVILGGFFLGKSFAEPKNNEVVPEKEAVPTPANDEVKIYSTLYNQGYFDSVVGYKGELYLISEYAFDNSAMEDAFVSQYSEEELETAKPEFSKRACFTKLTSEELVFENGNFECSSEDDEWSGNIHEINIIEANVKEAYAKQSFRTDGATILFFVLNDGTVSSAQFVDSAEIKNNILNGYSVKEISDYKCAKFSDNGCEEEKITVVLEDGTSKELSYK